MRADHDVIASLVPPGARVLFDATAASAGNCARVDSPITTCPGWAADSRRAKGSSLRMDLS